MGESGGYTHVPVMRERILALLAPSLQEPDAVFVDGTVGLGGHARAVLDAHPHVRLIGIDRDAVALDHAARALAPHADRITLVHAIYDELPDVLTRLGLPAVQAILLDLGVSSMQLDDASRGFAYAHSAGLDMRMDASTGATAADILNEYSAADLARVLREYGEERFARRIADEVVRRRGAQPFTNSDQLVDVVKAAIPAPARRTGGNPAKRTFQALRIEVNGELAALERALPAALGALAVRGRIAVLAYHSLEDRLVKRALTEQARPSGPLDLPVTLPGHEPRLRLLTRGAERPGDDETHANPRAASARLRAAERLREAA